MVLVKPESISRIPNTLPACQAIYLLRKPKLKPSMGLFNFWKSPKFTCKFPENDLEDLLIQASKDFSFRDDLYVKLMWSELFVITKSKLDKGHDLQTPDQDLLCQLVTAESGHIPVFTSVNRIFDKNVIKQAVNYVGIKGQDLFAMAQGAAIYLNPYSEYGKELTALETRKLFDGSIFEKMERLTLKKDTEILLGQPVAYPDQLVNALSECFAREKGVNAAYIGALGLNPNAGPSHLLIGLDVAADLEEVIQAAIPIVEKHLDQGEFLDFIQIQEEEDISDYFLQETQPFYIKL